MASPTVLLIEDNPDTRRVLGKMLERLGCAVEFESDGRAAIARARKSPPNLILLDMRLPGLDGQELLPKIRATRGLETVPIVGISGYSFPEMRREAVELGCVRFLEKPVSLEAQRDTLAEVLGHPSPGK